MPDWSSCHPRTDDRRRAKISRSATLPATMNEAIQPGSSGPRRSRGDGERTRNAIVRAAAALVAVDGLESLSIASVAAAVGLSKSGLHAHFGSKTELQLATVAEAARIFAEEVVQPALAAPPGLAQLTAVCEAFFAYPERRTYPADVSWPAGPWSWAPVPDRS